MSSMKTRMMFGFGGDCGSFPAAQGVMGEPFNLIHQSVTTECFHSFDNSGMECPPTLL